MKLYVLEKRKYVLDWWKPVVQNDTNGTITYEYDRTLPCTIISGKQQVYMHTDTQVPWGAMVRNVKDATGRFIFATLGEQYDMYVTSSEPSVDIYGNLTGYRQVLRRTKPRDVDGATHF